MLLIVILIQYRSPTTLRRQASKVWALSLSLATTQEIIIYFLFLGVLRCFSSPRSLTIASIIPLHGIGLPHSEISGSKCMCHSPKLIAAYHVLRRLSNPRHPPYALSNFQILIIFFVHGLNHGKFEIDLTLLTTNMSKNFFLQPITFSRASY